MQAYSLFAFFGLISPLVLNAQPSGTELPLPRLEHVSMVIKVRHSFMPEERKTRLRDTVAVYLIGRDGYVTTAYTAEMGYCTGQESYELKDGKLIKRQSYKALDPHPPFVSPAKHSHVLTHEAYFNYQGGLLASSRETAGPTRTPSRETRYTYDRAGRLAAQYSKYPRQSLIFYPTRYDAVAFRYSGDSVFELHYCEGHQQDSLTFLERKDKSDHVIERYHASPDGEHYERELYHYDTAGRLAVYEFQTDTRAVERNGKVLHADRIEYAYDAQGRIEEERYFARGLKRWAFQYCYLNDRR